MNDSLLPALEPRSVAIVGASEDQNRIGGRPIHFMLRHGFRGRILPVNPNRPVVQGLPAFDSIDAVARSEPDASTSSAPAAAGGDA